MSLQLPFLQNSDNMTGFSFWEIDTWFAGIDFAVIGSGITGLNAAIRLKEKYPSRKVTIFERGMLPAGASTRNAGFACFGSLTELAADMETHSESEVFDLIKKRWTGLKKLRERCGDNFLDYQNHGGTEIFRAEEKAIADRCTELMPWFNDRLQKVTGMKNTFVRADERIKKYSFAEVEKLIVNRAEGQIDTGKMMRRLLDIARAKGVEIMTGAEIESLKENKNAVSLHLKNYGTVEVGKVIVAVNGFANRLLPQTDLQPARNQVVITAPLQKIPFQGCFHYNRGYFYFRNIGNRVLLGGGRNLAEAAETTDAFGETELIQNALRDLLGRVILPKTDYQIEQSWSGILGVGTSKNPIVKKISERTAVAVRLGGMGVAIGSLTGEEAADLF